MMITYLPKFNNSDDWKAKQKEIKDTVATLKASGKLTNNELEELEDLTADMPYVKGTYSKNYTIRRINEMTSFVNCR